MKRHADLPSEPDGWRDPEALRELFNRRGWSKQEIADHFNAISDDEVTYGVVKWQLHRHGIKKKSGNQPPTNSLSRRLWEMDPDDLPLGGESA